MKKKGLIMSNNPKKYTLDDILDLLKFFVFWLILSTILLRVNEFAERKIPQIINQNYEIQKLEVTEGEEK